uniref:Trifunctional enzyme subunit alpha, mitochondrial n=1 Tax=Cacopsylla melanoneura TaxID=428564 RepID=A0A8D9FET4_9HEMI
MEVVRTGIEKGPVAGDEAEAEGFSQLAMTPQSKGLMGLFRAQTECKKNRFGKTQSPVKTVAGLGAGLMGAGQAVTIVAQYKSDEYNKFESNKNETRSGLKKLKHSKVIKINKIFIFFIL